MSVFICRLCVSVCVCVSVYVWPPVRLHVALAVGMRRGPAPPISWLVYIPADCSSSSQTQADLLLRKSRRNAALRAGQGRPSELLLTVCLNHIGFQSSLFPANAFQTM